MKISGGLTEKGVVIGNTYDKYNSGNPIVRRIMQGFESALLELMEEANPAAIHEVGCGEGYWVLRWLEQGLVARGSDFSSTVIDLARNNATERSLPEDAFKQQSIYNLHPEQDSADLVVCCEVLEHLEQPEEALRVLQKISQRYVIVSVPREPIWSMMNMLRGKYWSDLGNTPGHIQRWSQREFIQMVSQFFRIEQVRAPFPWTMLLCSSDRASS
jgi:2-polyprenyl-3-methyl-5-hydroxy-6-metoxy-1,4-benzoquinol methylase